MFRNKNLKDNHFCCSLCSSSKSQLGSSFLCNEWDLSRFCIFIGPLGFPGLRPREGPLLSGCDYRAGLHPLLEVKWRSAQQAACSRVPGQASASDRPGCSRSDQGKDHTESYFSVSSRNRGGMLHHETTHRKEKSFLKKYIFQNFQPQRSETQRSSKSDIGNPRRHRFFIVIRFMQNKIKGIP